MTQNEAEQMIVDELGKHGCTDVTFNKVFMGENTIRASVIYMKSGASESKELIVLRVGGKWQVLM